MGRTSGSRILGMAAVLVTGGLLLVRRLRGRRVPAGRGRGPDDGGGLAGVREPRRPLPTHLVDAGAAMPGE